MSLLQTLEKLGEDSDFSVPITGCPYLTELGVEGLVELAMEVRIVGGVSGSDLEIRGELLSGVVGGYFVGREKWGLKGEEG